MPALLVDELLSILASSDMTAAAQHEEVEEWLTTREQDYVGYPNDFGDNGQTGLDWMIAVHHSNWENLPRPFTRRLNDSPAGLHTPGSSPEMDDRWADLMVVRTFYGEAMPFLTLGTLIATTSDPPEYLMCLQPACDSVRLSGVVPFPFVTLDSSTDRFDIVVMHNGQGLRLRVPSRGRYLKMLKFKASNTGVVDARRATNGYSFRSSGGVTLKWLAELKPIVGQRFAHEMASYMSRVGVDESEWLRLKSSGKPRRQ